MREHHYIPQWKQRQGCHFVEFGWLRHITYLAGKKELMFRLGTSTEIQPRPSVRASAGDK
jgi:hypothetical protein